MSSDNQISMQDKYTSTGTKFWQHRLQMETYRRGGCHTIISTHVSPTSQCNLHCSYCSVWKREQHLEIPLETIQEYLLTLKGYGLQAVILTGGGEPLLYSQIAELMPWILEQELKLALITNGTVDRDDIPEEVWEKLSWIRVSVNLEQSRAVRDDMSDYVDYYGKVDEHTCTLGASWIVQNASKVSTATMKRMIALVDALGWQYVRMLPDCLLSSEDLVKEHNALDKLLVRFSSQFGEERFFHQNKKKQAPLAETCHQAYFRPYLSEQVFVGNGLPGTVYPCDSVVLNGDKPAGRFETMYQICHASEVARFLERKIPMPIKPQLDCPGCVFTHTVEMLDGWLCSDGVQPYSTEEIMHEDFV